MGHVEGSRKQKVHQAWDDHGQDTAWGLGRKLGLQPSSLHTWFSAWRKADGTPKRKAPAKVKSPAMIKSAVTKLAKAAAKKKPKAKTAKAKVTTLPAA